MALTFAEQRRVAKITAKKIFSPGAEGTLNLADLASSATAIDAELDRALVAGDVGNQIDNTLNAAIPAPVNTLSVADRALHVAIVIAVRHGAM